MHDVFARALTHSDGFRAEASPLTWLMKIATHHCLNQIRVGAGGRGAAGSSGTRRRKPEGHGGRRVMETRDLVRRLLSRVDVETQAAVIHYHVDGMTLEEVAAALGRSVPTVRKRLEQFRRAGRRRVEGPMSAHLSEHPSEWTLRRLHAGELPGRRGDPGPDPRRRVRAVRRRAPRGPRRPSASSRPTSPSSASRRGWSRRRRRPGSRSWPAGASAQRWMGPVVALAATVLVVVAARPLLAANTGSGAADKGRRGGGAAHRRRRGHAADGADGCSEPMAAGRARAAGLHAGCPPVRAGAVGGRRGRGDAALPRDGRELAGGAGQRARTGCRTASSSPARAPSAWWCC